MRPTARMVFRICLVVFTILGVNFFALRWEEPQVAAGASSSYEVIDLVNQVRSANGLGPYQVDNALMAAAQSHSEYMAESGSVSHTGVGGSSPAGRAAAAGYTGSGVTENIMSGLNLSAAQAVNWWQGEGTHLSTLISTAAEDVGAGVGVSGDTVYYTLVVGHKGSGSSAVQQPPSTSGAAAAASTLPTPEIIFSVEVITPGPDGSILHTVKDGQTMWDIAAAYKVSLSDLYAINGLTDQSVIFPGERIFIRLPDKTLTPTGPTTGTPAADAASGTPGPGSSQPSPTAMPATRTPIPPTHAADTKTAPPETEIFTVVSSQPTPAASVLPGAARKGLDPLLILIGALIVIGASLIGIGSVLKRGP